MTSLERLQQEADAHRDDQRDLSMARSVVSPMRLENHGRGCPYRIWVGGKCSCWLAKSGRWPQGHPNHQEGIIREVSDAP